MSQSASLMRNETQTLDFHKKTFRVRGIPHSCKRSETGKIVKAALGLKNDDHGLKVCSIAFNCYRQARERVATISFVKVPSFLSNDDVKDEWEFSVPKSEFSQFGDPVQEGNDDFDPQEEIKVVVDTHFKGFTPLRSFHKATDHKVDCIAISGLGGHSFGSFKEKGGTHMWLRDSLPIDLPSARILIYGYDTRLEGSRSFQDVKTLAGRFRTHIRAIRGNSSRPHQPIPLLFIAHSLGGLILKQALIQMSEGDDLDRANLKATYAALFFGVPSQGMDISSLVPIVGNQPNREFLDSLGRNSQLLKDQIVNFPKAFDFKDSEIISFFETLESPTAEKRGDVWRMTGTPTVLVDIASATHGRPWELGDRYVLAINRTHSELIKFSHQDEDYEMVLHHLQRFCSLAVDVIDNRFRSESGSTLPKNSQESQGYILKASNEKRETPIESCLKSLAYPEMNNRENDIVAQSNKTCTWIFNHETFLAWLEQQCGLLWIRGKPGAGKSTLLKYTLCKVKRLERHQKQVLIISHFFHGRGADIQKEPLGLFRSLLHQLLKEAPEVLSELTENFQAKIKTQGEPEKAWKWHPVELQEILKSSILEVGKVYRLRIFVDALDECGELEAVRLVDYFQRLVSKSDAVGGSISICFSCRHYPVLTLDNGSEICVEDENQNDIQLYIRDELYRTMRDESKIRILEMEIVIRASGSFQWVVLVVSQVCDLNRRGKPLKVIQTHLKKTPPQLNDLYRDLLQQISNKSSSQSLHIMQWICFAIRPLTLDELRHAMIVDADTPYKSLAGCQNVAEYVETEKDMELLLKDLCHGLAEVRAYEGRRVVQFIHQSVIDFLVQDGLRILDPSLGSTGMTIGRAHFRLSRSCIKYISMEEVGTLFDRLVLYDKLRITGSKAKLKLLEYAVEFWLKHTQAAEREGISQGDLVGMFQWPSNQIAERWISIDRKLYNSRKFASQSCLLHIASSSALISVAQAILEVGTDIELKDDNSRTPLWYAISGKREDTVKFLLSAGANLESKDSDGWTPLMHAARGGTKDIVNLLLSAGANLESKDSNGWTPLAHAACWGTEDIIKLLLSAGANLESKDSDGWTPLMHTASEGAKDKANLLLSAGANLESKDPNGWTPLMHAARIGAKDIINLLLSAGANLESKDSNGWTPLVHAASEGAKDKANLLLSAGANLESKDPNGWTPLMHAVRIGAEDIINLLLSAGANSESKDINGLTPLMHTARWGTEDIIKLLLSAGANLESKDSNGWTPLMHTARWGTKDMVNLLLSAGANLESRDSNGWTSLMVATAFWRQFAVKMLLEAGAKTDVMSQEGETALSIAIRKGYKEIERLLRDRISIG